MNLDQLINIASKLSLAVVLLLILWGGSTGVWIYGQTYRDMVADRDQWKALALQGAHVATQAAQRTAPIGANIPIEMGMTPLSDNANAATVRERLKAVATATAYKTEPTDEPVK